MSQYRFLNYITEIINSKNKVDLEETMLYLKDEDHSNRVEILLELIDVKIKILVSLEREKNENK